MEGIKANPILKFNANQLEHVRQVHGYNDVNKLKQDLDQLKDWILKQDHFRVKNYDQGFLERMLIYNKGSVERTKQKLDRLCTSIFLMPDYFQNFDIQYEFRSLQNVIDICMLPKPTKDNYRVLISHNTGRDDSNYQLIDFFRYSTVFVYYLLHNDYCQGFEVIGDTTKLPLGIMAKINPITLSKGLSILTDSLSQRIKRLHLISGSKFFDALLTLVKQGLSAKLKERIVIHPNYENLYEYIPREQLPKDYGGDEKSISEITEMNFKELCSDEHIKNVKFLETASTNESFRQVLKFNEEYSGMPGSFKTLCVD